MWFHSDNFAPWERVRGGQAQLALDAFAGATRHAEDVIFDDGHGNRFYFYWAGDYGDPTPAVDVAAAVALLRSLADVVDADPYEPVGRCVQGRSPAQLRELADHLEEAP